MQGSAFQLNLTKIIAPRLLTVCCLVFLVIARPGFAADGSNSNIKYGPPGGWVQPHFFDQQPSTSLLDASADQHVLLLERQMNAAQNEVFVHSVRQMLTLDGVQNGSTLTLEFNPGYQTLTWHWARIWRDGQHLERLDTNSVEVVQQEQDLDEYLLNGEKSAVLVLDDVRVGDIIDYAYSIKGENPVLGDHFSARVPVQLQEPVERLFTRVIWPSQRHLYARAHGCSVQPVATAGTGKVDYTWDLRQMPGVDLEDSLPAWYDPEPSVQLTEFETWAEVNQWALALFKTSPSFSPELNRKIEEWKQISDHEQQILAVLQFVQDQVRYFGIEIGTSTEKPADPSKVFSRRFGDCKDKSLLFVTILRTLGISAYPVLVNSTMGRAMDDWLPAADDFDHCIAVVQCDGQTYWLDPTMNYQRGPLAAHYLPDYERGLIISPYTTELSAIPQATGLPQTSTTEYFQLRGKTEPADLKVVTVAEGRDAEILRAFFATTKRADIEKSYTHFYADLFPGIKMTSPVAVEDDESQNTFQTTEFYSIDNAWTLSDKDHKYRCQFYPSAIAALLKMPVDTDRKLPLAVDFPEHQILRTEVTLPEDWPAGTDQKTIDDPAFTLRKNCRLSGNKLVMEYEYQSLADSVSPDSAGDYIQRLNQGTQDLGYTLSWR
jgi:hypothetical protein